MNAPYALLRGGEMNAIQRFFENLRKGSFRAGYTCDACGKELFDYPAHRICAACEQGLQRNTGKTCDKCGRKTVADGICLNCKRDLPAFERGVSPFVYRGSVAAYVNRFKKGEVRLTWYFGARMAETLIERVIRPQEDGSNALGITAENPLLLVPVPLTEARKAERGYNQAERLAEAVQEKLLDLGLPVEMDTDILIKTRDGEQQKHIGYQARRENVSGAYRVEKRKACKDRTIVLIDDVLTTGATGSECADRLLRANAKTVIFLTAASLEEQK